ncbi:hypothetical protein [Thiohalomonas denitrificans]|uniref:hypothetical protein n=1 Tax=Thiohalomonas denitrificans TaxID=415747 RepID=UPI0026E9F2DC|nr:hypothetical protein [Thiohalomonas denitrificans]
MDGVRALDIKIQDELAHLSPDGVDYGVAGSGSEVDLAHNYGVWRRNSSWVTPSALQAIEILADDWYLFSPETKKLCFNDASLEYGGSFDSGDRPNYESGTAKNLLHYYHQIGRDVDINRKGCTTYEVFYTDAVGWLKMTFDSSEYAAPVTMYKKDLLESIANSLGGKRYPESTIHYRF